MKYLILFLFLSLNLSAQVYQVTFDIDTGTETLTIYDAILTDTLKTEPGIISNIRVEGFDLVHNGHETLSITETIVSDGFLQFAQKAPKRWVDSIGRVYTTKPKHTGWYVELIGTISHEVYIDGWGYFGPINGGL